MENFLLTKRSTEVTTLSLQLGYTKTLFNGEDFEVLTASNSKDLISQVQAGHKQKRFVFYKAPSEELLRFALEKSEVDGVLGVEEIHLKDSLHYVRGGLDPVLCRFAAARGRKVVFSFNSILNSPEKAKLLARMRFNISLCEKFGVLMLFSNFVFSKEEMRAAKDLQAFWRVLKQK